MALEGITIDDMADLLVASLPYQPKGEFTVALKRQRYEVCDVLLRGDAVVTQSGNRVEHRVKLTKTGRAAHVRLYDVTKPAVANVLDKIQMEWCFAQSDWSVEYHEGLMCSGVSELINLGLVRRLDGVQDLVDVLEDAFFAVPDPADTKVPWGLRYWICKVASAGQGFYGGLPTGFSDVGGIAPCTSGSGTSAITGGEEYWRNWCAGGTGYYDAVDETLVDTMSTAFYKIRFQSPRMIQELHAGPLSRLRIYCNIPTKVAYERLQRANNDQLGADLSPYGGQTSFKRLPIREVPILDEDTSNPIYMIDMGVFQTRVLRGDYLRETAPKSTVAQHNVMTGFWDLTYQYIATDRRRLAVISQL